MLSLHWLLLIIPVAWLFGAWWGRFASRTSKQGECWHHDRSTGESWLSGVLIDNGMRKQFTCIRCGRIWFT